MVRNLERLAAALLVATLVALGLSLLDKNTREFILDKTDRKADKGYYYTTDPTWWETEHAEVP